MRKKSEPRGRERRKLDGEKLYARVERERERERECKVY